MKDIKQRIEEQVSQMFSYWYFHDLPKYSFEIGTITPVIGPIYLVDINLHVWHNFELRALYVDGERPGVFLDGFILSHLVETPMLKHYALNTLDIGALVKDGYAHLDEH